MNFFLLVKHAKACVYTSLTNYLLAYAFITYLLNYLFTWSSALKRVYIWFISTYILAFLLIYFENFAFSPWCHDESLKTWLWQDRMAWLQRIQVKSQLFHEVRPFGSTKSRKSQISLVWYLECSKLVVEAISVFKNLLIKWLTVIGKLFYSENLVNFSKVFLILIKVF